MKDHPTEQDPEQDPTEDTGQEQDGCNPMAVTTRDGNGRFSRDLEVARRDGQAAALRARGLTYQQIADQLDMSSKAVAYRAVQRALVDTMREPADSLRVLEAERLDELSRRAWSILARTHHVVSHGRVVMHNGAPLVDPAPTLAAIDRLLKISERRSRLLGLDAPQSVQMISLDKIDAEILRLEAELVIPDENEDER